MPAPVDRDDLVVEEIFFPGPSGQLQGELVYPGSSSARQLALFAGPHPFLGGTMHNNVTQGLGDGLASHGIASLRFNYRGVGSSSGSSIDLRKHLAEFWHTGHVSDERELASDVVAAGRELLRNAPAEAIQPVLIGYSFGCSLLPEVLETIKASALILIAPTINRHDYSSYRAIANRPPILVIADDGDFVSDQEKLQAWFDSLPAPRCLHRTRLDNHFFRGHEPWLVERVHEFLEEYVR